MNYSIFPPTNWRRWHRPLWSPAAPPPGRWFAHPDPPTPRWPSRPWAPQRRHGGWGPWKDPAFFNGKKNPWKMVIFPWFTYEKWWLSFHRSMLNYQRVDVYDDLKKWSWGVSCHYYGIIIWLWSSRYLISILFKKKLIILLYPVMTYLWSMII